MEIGKRVIFDKNTGKVLNGTFEEMSGSIEDNLRPLEIDFIDLPYGYDKNNFKEAIKYHVNIETREIVIDEYIQKTKTPEELRIEELENQLLLMADSLEGGIL